MKYKKPYIIGIGGSGVSNIAFFFLSRGIKVYGSDIKESSTTQKLEAMGAEIFFEQRADNIKNVLPDGVFYSQSILGGAGAQELKIAEEFNIPCFKNSEGYQELIGEFKRTIAISGAHGKTTTTAMTGIVLKAAGLDPEVISGSTVKNFEFGSYERGNGDYFVVEACEYRDQYLAIKNVELLVILNIDFDHPDYFKNLDDTAESFIKFADNLNENGKVLINIDQEITQNVATKLKKAGKVVHTFGENGSADFVISNIIPNAFNGYSFEIHCSSTNVNQSEFPIRANTAVLGKQNVWNGAAALICALLTGNSFDLQKVVQSLTEFKGTSRRQENIGEYKGIPVYDDYAHHPNQISVTIEGFQQKFKKVGVIFEPHQYSRTAGLLQEFSKSLSLAPVVLLFPIFKVPGRDTDEDVRSTSIEKVGELLTTKYFIFTDSTHEEIVKGLNILVENGCDCILNLGAGPLISKIKEAIV